MNVRVSFDVLVVSAHQSAEAGKLSLQALIDDKDMFALTIQAIDNMSIGRVESLKTIIDDRIRGEAW